VLDYESLADDALVAEVARRMPQDQYHERHGNSYKCYPFYDEDEERDPAGDVWGYWFPLLNPGDLEDVKREIERRRWTWRTTTHYRDGKLEHFTCIDIPGRFNSCCCPLNGKYDESRALLLAYLRADDAEKEASGE